MAKRLQLRGGTTAQHEGFVGAPREVTVNTDTYSLVVHDGATSGGIPVPTTASINLLIDGRETATPTISIVGAMSEGVTVQGTIGAYDSQALYTVTADGGTIVYNGGSTFSFTAPSVEDDSTVVTISAYATKVGELRSGIGTANIAINNVPIEEDDTTLIQVVDIFNDLETNNGFEEIV